MYKQKTSILLIISLLIISLCGCDKIGSFTQNITKSNVDNTKPQTSQDTTKNDDSYYSIIQDNVIKETNEYIESYIRYPKIVRSTGIQDSLVDPINDEITNEIDKIVNELKNTANSTFQTYLKSSVENIEKDKNNKIEALKKKYKNIIGSNEVKELSTLINKNTTNNISNDKKSTESILTGFTTTKDLINEGPHNKKIIVVETTSIEQEIKQTTTIVEGSPKKIAPPEKQNNNDFKNNYDFDMLEKASISFTRKKPFDTKNKNIEPSIYEKPTETTKPEVETINNIITTEKNEIDIVNVEIGNERIDEELTLNSFYKELNEIKNIKTPSKEELTNSYIKTYLDCNYQIMCLDEDYISMYIDISAYRTGNLINEKRVFKNIDIKNSKIVTLKDILGENYKEKCIDVIKNKIDNLDEDLKNYLKSDYNLDKIITDKTPFFINNNHLPVISLEKNQIAIGPVGYISIVIK